MAMRKVAPLAVIMALAGGVLAFGFAGAAYALASPSIVTSQQPGSATIGSSIADHATVSAPASSITCPPEDSDGYHVGQSDTSSNPIFCSYPAFQGENPNDFYCEYDQNTGALVTDHDSGLCPATAAGVSPGTPTGTVTFNLYDNSTGSGTPLFTDTENLGNGVATSASYTTTATGTDYWVATYNGDTNYNSVTSGVSDEPVTITAASPSLSAAGPGSGMAGTPISASSISASLSGGTSPSGTITFKVFGPQSSAPTDCSGGSTVGTASVSGSGNYSPSSGFTPGGPGDYWWYASYGGDSNNNGASSTCGAGMSETVVGGLTPAISQVSPNGGSVAGSNTVTITGTGFVSGAIVKFGSVAASSVTFDSATQLEAVVPAAAGAGTVAVRVRTPGGTSPLGNGDLYAYGVPAISQVSPNAGTVAGGKTVTITGTGFVPGAIVKFGTVAASSVTFDSATKLQAVVPAAAGAGTVAVRVRTAAGTSLFANGDLYAYGAPAISHVSPNAGSVAGGKTVTITGTGFVPGATVNFGSVAASSVTFNSATQLQAVVPAAAGAGTVAVRVHTAAGTSPLGNGDLYAYGAPAISQVSPNAGSVAGGNTVTITGTGFVPGATVKFGSVAASSVTVVSATKIQAVAPAAAAAGTVAIVAHTPAGSSAPTSADSYTYRP